MLAPDYPVVVVGGGPIGLTAALELAHHGIRCAVIEPRTVVEHSRPRAKTTSARTMELFRRWGAAQAIRDAAPLKPEWSNRVTFATTATGAEIAHIDGCLGLSTPPEVSPERGQQISQGAVEEVLRRLVADRPLVDLFLGWRAVSADQGGEFVRVDIEGEHGTRRTLTARWGIGADGPRSIVRSTIGARYEGAAGGRPNVNITFRSRGLAGLIPHPPSIHYWSVNPVSPGVVGPLDLDGTWWAISTGTARIDSDAQAAEVVRGLVGAEIDVEIIATDPWQARMLLADRYRGGRLLIVGDAAHQNPPWGGHGFNTGVGDAVNACWKLAAVLQGWAPEELIDTYESDRRPIAAQTIRVAESNMATLSIDLVEQGGRGAELAERIVRDKSPEFHSDGLIFGYGYGPAASGFDAYRYIPRMIAGARLPHRLVDGTPIHDLLGTGFTALGAGAESFRHAAGRAGIPLTVIDAPGETVLVRPDQHIAWAGGEPHDAEHVLSQAIAGRWT
ncbi:MAG: FAD-dependent oxidoreductase [Gordonia sp. (in: high G+C Gram-positive bacteria)]